MGVAEDQNLNESHIRKAIKYYHLNLTFGVFEYHTV